MRIHERLGVGLSFAIWYWALLAACQAVLHLAEPGGGGPARAASYLLRLPLLQAENLLAAATLGLLGAAAAGWRRARWGVFGLYVALSAATLADVVYYRLFTDHFRLAILESVGETNAALAWSSFTAEIDFAFWGCAALAAAASLGVALSIRRPRSPGRAVVASAAILAAAALAGAPGAFRRDRRAEHPLVSLAAEWWAGPMGDRLRAQPAAARTPAAVLPAFEATIDADPRLPVMLSELRKNHATPNMVLILLESVGSEQVLDSERRFSPVVTPNLSRLAGQSILFDSIYAVFPGTTRSLVALYTGGYDLTWAGLFELRYKYLGPTLPWSLASAGYETAFFSSERMDGEGTDLFLTNIGFRRYYDFSRYPPGDTGRHMVHSWGSNEELTLERIAHWLDRDRDPAKPFFLNYANAATHHPYGVPRGYPKPFRGGDRKANYLNALHYTDAAVGRLLAMLESRGLGENTVVAVTGDHGEAFSEYHLNNFTHKYELYDENIREFLLLSHPLWRGSPALSHRVAQLGDAMPTLLDLAGIDAGGVKGRSLLAASFEQRPVFFHKLMPPEKWGVRDGPWKYIGGVHDGTHQLFDLTADQREQENLASRHPERAAAYAVFCREAYLRGGREITARLKDYPGRVSEGAVLLARTATGPQSLQVGVIGQESGGPFVARRLLAAAERPMAWTQWAVCDRPAEVEYQWVGPGGAVRIVKSPCPVSASDLVTPYPGPLPLTPGSWQVRLAMDGVVKMTASFTMDGPDRGNGTAPTGR